MLCTSLAECIESLRPRQIMAISSPLGGYGALALARMAKLSIVTSGPVFNKLVVLDAIDNYNIDVRYIPRLYTSVYKFVGDRECWVAGPPLVKSTVSGSSTSVSMYSCSKIEGFEKITTGGKPIESLSSSVLGGGKDGRDYDIVVKLRSLSVKGDDEEEIADRIIRSGVLDIDDLDIVSQRIWHVVSNWRNRSVILFRDPVTNLGITISLLYYSTKVVAAGRDCPKTKCVKTTTKVIERALKLAPQSNVHDIWIKALRDPQHRRKIEESPYIPAFLILTGKVDVKLDMSTRIYTIRAT
ncbi:MAG: hypothetical protein QW680_00625 [Pyrobaculum sp.]